MAFGRGGVERGKGGRGGEEKRGREGEKKGKGGGAGRREEEMSPCSNVLDFPPFVGRDKDVCLLYLLLVLTASRIFSLSFSFLLLFAFDIGKSCLKCLKTECTDNNTDVMDENDNDNTDVNDV